MARKSDHLNAELAEAIQAQPVSAVDAAIAELRAAGLDADADRLARVLAERKAKLEEAHAVKAAEEAAVRQHAIAKAQDKFADRAAEYVVLRDEALDSLAQYVQLAVPAMSAFKAMEGAALALDRLTGLMAERPLSATKIFAKDERFKSVRNLAFNSNPL
jgi:hypothetical protein